MTKKNIFLGSLASLIVGYVIIEFMNKGCFGRQDFICSYVVGIGGFAFFLSIPILFFSFVTYFFSDNIFRLWIIWTKWWVPVTILLILVTPKNDGGGGMLSMSSGGIVAILLFALYVLVSIGIIIYRSIQLPKK